MSQSSEVQAAYTDVKLEKLQSHFLQGDEDSAAHFDGMCWKAHNILCLRFDNWRAAMHAFTSATKS